MKWTHGRANVTDWVPSETGDNAGKGKFHDESAGKGKYEACCTETDLWKANKISIAFTMHAREADKQGFRCRGTECGDVGEDRFKGVCDKNGCDIQRTRFMGKDQTQELLALVDTITVLNDDDALELFKKIFLKRCQQILADPGHRRGLAPGSH